LLTLQTLCDRLIPYHRHFCNTAAQSAHRTFVARADAFAADMQRFVTDRENKKRSIRKDLMEKRSIKMEELKTELDLYNKLLGVQREEIEECINHMEEQAQELIGLYAIGVKREREAARAQAQATTGDEEDEEEGEEAIV